MQNFVCALQDWRLCFSQSSGSPIIKVCWPQDQIPWRLPVPLSDPQAGKPDVEFRTFTAVQDFFGIIVLQSVGHPPGGYGVWFYYDCTLLPCHYSFLFVFGHGISFFGGFRHPPVNSCSTASCYFGALAGDEHTSFYFAILNQKFPICSWCRLINSECILSHCSTPLFGYICTCVKCTHILSFEPPQSKSQPSDIPAISPHILLCVLPAIKENFYTTTVI